MNSQYDSVGDASTFLARAELMFDLDRFDEAREEIAGAISADPAHVPALTLLAILELQVGNYDDALTASSAALAAEPTHDLAVLARAHSLALLHRNAEALSAADEIQQRYAESWWHNVHYALIIREVRNGQDALDAAWAAVHLEPDEARAHLTLAVIAATLGVDDLADRALAAASRLNPDIDSLLQGELGPTLLRNGPGAIRGARQPDIFAAEPKEHEPLPEPLQRCLRIAGAVGVAIPMLAAIISGGEAGLARIVAGIGAVAGIVAIAMLVKRLPTELQTGLGDRIDHDKVFGLAVLAAACGPVLAVLYAFTGVVYLLGIAAFAGLATFGVTLLLRARN